MAEVYQCVTGVGQSAPTWLHRSVTDSSSGKDVPKQFAGAYFDSFGRRSISCEADTSDRSRCLKIEA
jgi:hypothetical protein